MRTSEPFCMAFVQMTVCSMQHETVQAANASILISEQIGANQKGVNEVYLATIGKDVDTFSSSQSDDLFAIASQCPMVGGNAVFKARSLFWMIDDNYHFDDQLLCLPHGIIVKSLIETLPNAVSIIPNPAGDEATLVLTGSFEEAGLLVLYDAVGNEVLGVRIPAETLRVPFSTRVLAPALYHYRVHSGSEVLGTGKLTIVR